jgi:hypothetical protein
VKVIRKVRGVEVPVTGVVTGYPSSDEGVALIRTTRMQGDFLYASDFFVYQENELALALAFLR